MRTTGSYKRDRRPHFHEIDKGYFRVSYIKHFAWIHFLCYTIPMHKSYHILSVEAADIYRAEQENGGAVGVQLPERNSDDCFRLFKVFLDNSLDSAALEKAYTRVCRKKFSFASIFTRTVSA